MASVKEILERLESVSLYRELCPHLPPIIHWPDGRSENVNAPHSCGLPRLTVTLGFSDGTDMRTQAHLISVAVKDILDLAKECPQIPIMQRVEWASIDYGVGFDELSAAMRSAIGEF